MTDRIIITRTFPATREQVYAAWTEPEQFSVWFGTEAVDVPLDTVSMDVRVGGTWKAVMHLPDGNTIHWVGEYIEVEPPERLAFSITDNPSNPAREPVTVDFVEVDGGTEMTLRQAATGFSQVQLTRTVAGYNGFFDDMAKVIAARAAA